MDIDDLATHVRPVAEAEGLRLVVLFGSRARGDARSEADLDVAVDAGEPVDVIDLTNKLGVALEDPGVDLVDLRRADPVMLLSVAEEGIPLYQREPSAFVRFQSLAARRFYDTRKFREAQRDQIRERLERLERST